MNDNYYVYMHVSPSGKRYVGITQDYIKRWRKGLGYYDNKYFYNAIQKYGWDNFEHIIIAENLSLDDAAKMEIELIAKYKSNDREYGYNHAEGGVVNRGYKLSEETRKKLSESHKGISNSNKGKKLSEEHRQKLSDSAKRYHETHEFVSPMKGKHHSEDTKRRMSNAHKGKISGENNPHYGKHLSEEHRRKISESNKGRCFSDEHRKHLSESLKGKPSNRSNVVIQYSLNNEYIQKFNNVAEAERITGISKGAIYHAVKGNTKGNISNGFIWRYEKEVI